MLDHGTPRRTTAHHDADHKSVRQRLLSEHCVHLLATIERPGSPNGALQDLVVSSGRGRTAFVLLGWQDENTLLKWEVFLHEAEARARLKTDGLRLVGLNLPAELLFVPSGTWARPGFVRSPMDEVVDAA